MNEWIPRAGHVTDKLVDWSALEDAGGTARFIAGRDVLDVGAAWGTDAMFFANAARRYVTAEHSQTCIDHLRKLTPIVPIDVVQFDATKPWPFDDASFDTVLDCSSIDDMRSDVAPIYREAVRVLRPGGLFFTSYANAAVIRNPVEYTITHPAMLVIMLHMMGCEIVQRTHEHYGRATCLARKR